MPTHSVINRRNISPLERKTLLVSPAGIDAVTAIAKHLSVSQGSLVDTALRHLATQDPTTIIELLHHHGHLTDAERDAVRAVAGIKPGRKKP